jgi:multimeric flavodoxin WrbA
MGEMAVILGISGSGRTNGIISQAVKEVLLISGMEYEYITLAGKNVQGCIGCLQCAGDNICKLNDDFAPIAERMKAAEAVVLGAPCYYDFVNAKTHALIERTAYSFHHNSVYVLGKKPCITVSTRWVRDKKGLTGDATKDYMQWAFVFANRMESIGHITAQGYGCCYLCNFGHNCKAGNAMTEKSQRLGGFEKEDLPLDFPEQTDTLKQIHDIVKILKNKMSKKHQSEKVDISA